MSTLNKQPKTLKLDGISPLDRLNAAKAALAAAETKQGLRSAIISVSTDRTSVSRNPFTLVPEPTEVTEGSNPSIPEHPTVGPQTVSTQRNAPHAVVTQTNSNARTTITRADRQPIPTHPALHTLLPHGLQRGAITTTQGSTHTALTLITQHTKNGGWAAIIGAPNINYLTLQDLGADLTKIITIPHPGEKTPEVIAALIEGVDLLLLGNHVTLTTSEQRTLTARNKERGTHIITQKPWHGARTHLTTLNTTWHGPNHGLGRLTNASYTLTTTSQNHRHTTTLTTHNGQLTATQNTAPQNNTPANTPTQQTHHTQEHTA